MTYSINKLEEWLGVAEKAANDAGSFLASIKKRDNIRADFTKDVKILADLQSEKIILGKLKKETNFDILSEEKGLLLGSSSRGLCWIVDPLDGTVNFLRGIPISCVSIGLWDDNRPLLGVVYDFNKDELFTGIVGVSAWLNHKKIKVSTIPKKEKAVLCTGFPAATDFSTKNLGQFVKKVQDFKKVRLLGSAALSLAYVASGRADAYIEDGIKHWDIAAGVALVKSAGGMVQIKTAANKGSCFVGASNNKFPLK